MAPNATVVGDVELVDRTTTVWYGAVLRGDDNHISVRSKHSKIPYELALIQPAYDDLHFAHVPLLGWWVQQYWRQYDSLNCFQVVPI